MKIVNSAMPYQELQGNLFASDADALVNTVNCVGPMGKGIALEFRRRYPEMYVAYREVCERPAGEEKLKPGMILPYKKTDPWILNFAVKNDWKHPSKVEWVSDCLRRFREWYPKVGLGSVAFPWMGAMNGKIPLDEIKRITREYLEDLDDIDVEVYEFDPDASCPLFDVLKTLSVNYSPKEFASHSGVRRVAPFEAIFEGLDSGQITSLTHVVQSKVLGKASLDKLYIYLTKMQMAASGNQLLYQPELFS